MAFRNSSFGGLARTLCMGSVMAFAALPGANVALAQASNTATKHNGALDSFADLAEKVEPAVIGVTSRPSAPQRALPEQFEFGAPGRRAPERNAPEADGAGTEQPPDESMAIGSGFFISADGYAVTSSRIVASNNQVEIRTNDDKVYPARIVGKDALSGLALIKVDGRSDFNYVKLAERAPRVGDWILTVGNPFGLRGTVTAGIVSARDRDIPMGPGEGFIQIDAPINSGDSGGPSFNTEGDVIGINSMIFSPSGGSTGVAFAIPADTAKTVIPQLKEKGTVTRGSMEAEVQSVTPEIADSLGSDNLHGAIVASVKEHGPAAKAGIKSGDVITSVAGEPIKSANELTRKIYAMAPGSTVALATVREGKQGSQNVTLSELPKQTKSAPAPR